MNLEDDLRRALRRQPVSPQLTARVLDRVRRSGGNGPRRAPLTMRQVLIRGLAAAAAIGTVAVGIPRYYAEHERTIEGERATREVMLALAITNEKLALVQQRLEESGR